MAETESKDAPAYTSRGTERERFTLPSEMFDGTVNMPVMHQAVKAYLANQRQGNAATKIRKYVIGGNQKPWKQKGTGRARQGSIRAPQWVGGGTVFGPIPRSYAQYVPKQVRALARKSAFNARANEGAIYVVDLLDFSKPKTARLKGLVNALGLGERKVLILTDGIKPNVYLSGRNLQAVQVMPFDEVSAFHILWSEAVLVESSAIGDPLAPTDEKEPEDKPKRERQAPKRPAAKVAAKKTSAAKRADKKASPSKAATKKAGKKTAKKAAKKSATKKSATKKTSAKKSATKKTAGKSAAKKSSGRKKGGK
ncbi:MAG: 50S ribosomal protein L4 [Anaerolineae bacterium]|nr:50S ribosomal protein L4 [Gemmatimonadaceae bacterium]